MFEYPALVFGGYNTCVSLTFVHRQKYKNAGNIKGNTTIRTSIYWNIHKQASKLRHAMASHGKPGNAKQRQA